MDTLYPLSLTCIFVKILQKMDDPQGKYIVLGCQVVEQEKKAGIIVW